MPATATYGSAPLLEEGGRGSVLGTLSLDDYLLLAGILLSGLLSGLYFIFSFCVMWALAKLDSAVAAHVMNEINVVIINPLFLSVFMGAPLVCVALLAGTCYRQLRGGGGGARERGAGGRCAACLKVLGALLLLVGEFGTTAGVNVPLNNALASVAKRGGGAEAGAFFEERFLGPWTTWNTVRCVASAGTLLCFALALRLKQP